MNRKKRALSLGLAAAQLAAFAPMYSQVAFAATDPYTITAKKSDGTALTVTNGAIDISSAGLSANDTITITVAPGADKKIKSVTAGKATADITNTANGNEYTYNVTQDDIDGNSITVNVTTFTVLAASYTGEKVTLTGTEPASGETYTLTQDDKDALAGAAKAAVKVDSTAIGDSNFQTVADADYTAGTGSYTVKLKLTDDNADYTLPDSATEISVTVPIEYAAPAIVEVTPVLSEAGTALTSAEATTAGAVADIADEAKKKLGSDLTTLISFDGTDVPTLASGDYTVASDSGTAVQNDKSTTATAAADVAYVKFVLTVEITSDGQKKISFGDNGSGGAVTQKTVDIYIPAKVVPEATISVTDNSVKTAVSTAVVTPKIKKGETEITGSDKVKVDDELTIEVALTDASKAVKWDPSAPLTLKVGSTPLTGANGVFSYTVKEEDITSGAITVDLTGTVIEDVTPYKITLPANGDGYTVSATYNDGASDVAIPADGLPAGKQVKITVTGAATHVLKSAKLEGDASATTSADGSAITLTYTVKAPASGDTIDLSNALTVVAAKKLTPEVSGTINPVQLTKTKTECAGGIQTEDETAVKNAAVAALGTSISDLSTEDYTLTIGAITTGTPDTAKVTLALTTDAQDKFVFTTSTPNATSFEVNVPLAYVAEYTIGTNTVANAVIAVKKPDGTALSGAVKAGTEVKITVKGDTNYVIKSEPTATGVTGVTFTENAATKGLWEGSYTVAAGDAAADTTAITATVSANPVPVVTATATVSSQTLTKTTKLSEALDADDVTTILDAVANALTFSQPADSSTPSLTRDNDYTLAIDTENFTIGNAAVPVKVSPKDGSNYALTETTINVTVTYAKAKLTAPTVKASNAGTPASIPMNSDSATIQDLLVAQLDLPADFDESLFDIAVANANVTSENTTAADATVTYTIKTANQDDYEFTTGTGVTATAATLTVSYVVTAEAKEITPVITVPASGKVVLTEAPTAANVATAVNATVAVTVTGGGDAPTTEHYTLETTYDNGTATVTFALNDAGKQFYKIAGGATTTVTVSVYQKLTLPTVSKVTCDVDASSNTTAENAIKQAVTDALTTAWGEDVMAKVTVGTPTAVDASAAAADKTAAVSVTLSGIYVLDDDATANASQNVNVTYDVVAVLPSSAITKAPATNGSFVVKVDNAEVTGNVQQGETVTVVPTADAGYEIDKVTYAVGAAAATEITAAADGSYTFEMPGEAVTVTVTFKAAVTPSVTEHNVTIGSMTNGRVTADVSKAAENAEVTLTVTPGAGYKLGTLTIAKASSGTVKPTKVNDTTYKFTMPAEAVTVNATFVKEQTEQDKTQTAPAAPTMKSCNKTSITLNEIAANANGAAAEYSKDGKTWQTSPKFTGLTKNTKYTFYARYAAVEGFAASPASEGTVIKTLNTSSSGGSSSGGGSSWYPSSGGSTSSGSRPADSSSTTTPNITNNTADDIDDVIDTKPTAANLSEITDTAEDVEEALKDISKPTVVEKQAATVLEAAIKDAKAAVTAADKAACAENIQLIMKALSTKAPKVRGDADNSGKVDSADVLLSVLNFRKYRTNAAGQLYTAVTMGVTDKTALNTNDILAFIKAFRTR